MDKAILLSSLQKFQFVGAWLCRQVLPLFFGQVLAQALPLLGLSFDHHSLPAGLLAEISVQHFTYLYGT